jgi:hypothetical protein
VAKKPKFRNLREFVNSYPRYVKQGDIAELLGIEESALSRYLGGIVPGRETALRLHREHDIDLEGLLDPPQPAAVAPQPSGDQ